MFLIQRIEGALHILRQCLLTLNNQMHKLGILMGVCIIQLSIQTKLFHHPIKCKPSAYLMLPTIFQYTFEVIIAFYFLNIFLHLLGYLIIAQEII